MIRFPRYFILLFVGLSVVTAFVIHRWDQGGSISLSSTATERLSGQIQEILKMPGVNITQELLKIGATGAVEVNNCQCTLAGIDSTYFQFESSQTCDPSRNYLKKDLQEIPALYREERSASSADFPRACMTYIMRMANADAEVVSSSVYAMCPNKKGKPQRGNFKPCITETYVNSVYNYFADLTDCMDVPQREYLPKLYNESGLHLNLLGRGFDAGIGQLVEPSIEDANDDFENYRAKIARSDKASCQRLAPYIAKLKPVPPKADFRCQLLTAPESPLLNMFYVMIKFHQDHRSIERRLDEYDILEKMRVLGLTEGSGDRQFQKEQLIQMLLILAYNSGATGAVSKLDDYLDAVKAAQRQLTKEDFDIGRESYVFIRVRADQKSSSGILLRPESQAPGQPEASRWEDRRARFEADMQEYLSSANRRRYKAKIEPFTVKDPKQGPYQSYKITWDPGQLSFAAYLMIYQTSGSAGYLSFVARVGQEINKVFKEGVCVPESYLAL
ncbi:MAG: hypothetical protein COT73_01795 [Bdellovibrio sp. CG10_big_fil_rev_8_21_14_0_10_47_8]|nr:MAG: hypothetical protein COT73_01795 [Bdellovibrio sp. CG10_big_fil_rev_8_21_14_0_10_47_8]